MKLALAFAAGFVCGLLAFWGLMYVVIDLNPIL